jgi:Short C-terminal domain
MPGLLRGVARTAVVAGTATAVSNRVSRRQARRWGYLDEPQQQQPPQQAYEPPPQQYAPPPPPPQAEEDPIAKLREYAKLRDDGILTDEEFEAQKRRLLG